MQYRGLGIDMDGCVLSESEGLQFQAWNIPNQLGNVIITPEFYKEQLVGKSLDLILKGIKERHGDNLPTHFDGETYLAARKARIHELVWNSEHPLADGALDLFTYIVENKIPAAIVTGGELVETEYKIQKAGLEPFVSRADIKLVTADREVNGQRIKGKPERDIYLLAANDLDINPQDMRGFEDSRAGYDSAVAAKYQECYATVTEWTRKVYPYFTAY